MTRPELQLPEFIGRHSRTGVYALRNILDDKLYIGSTGLGFSRRWTDHRLKLAKGSHGNIHLQRAYNRDGSEAFEFLIVEDCESEACFDCEQKWMNFFKPEYNIAKFAGGPRGYRHTAEAKKKIGDRFRGQALSKEHVAKMRGQTRSEEVRKKMSERMKGVVHPQEVRNKISATLKGNTLKRDWYAKQCSELMSAWIKLAISLSRSNP